MQLWKDITQAVHSTIAPVAILLAAIGYWRSKRLEAARWGLQLWEKFYEKDIFKSVRETLDQADAAALIAFTEEEPAQFTDYLNFFEFIAFLKRRKQLPSADVEELFGYYLDCLVEQTVIYNYVINPDKGYEQLSRLLTSRHNELRR